MTLPESWLALPRAASGTLDLFGLLGLLCGLATGLMPTRRLILLSSALCSVCFSLHFWRLGSTTGMAMNLIGVTQSLLAARSATRAFSARVSMVFS
ncbi:YgjV family protein [Methylorubrum extorquens]